MRKYLLLCVAIMASFSVFSQDFSNKGKDFWVGYGYHQSMGGAGGGSQNMLLYFATDQITTVTVSIPGLGYSITYPNIPANTVYAIPSPMPKSGIYDSRLTSEAGVPENKGIHITSDKPIIAYAHIYDGSVSGATILYPTNTLGKEYYSVNYDNVSNSTNANCWMYVVATDPGTTTVEITPSVATLTHAAGTTFTVTLTQGQIFNLFATYNNATLVGGDLTGSKFKSVALGLGDCKRIAVFSGSGRINIGCPASTSPSSDNYMVQALPKTAWGKNYLLVPTAGYNNVATSLPYAYNSYRICVLDPTTTVKYDGVALNPASLINNFYYVINATNVPHSIASDKSIMVAQYLPSRAQCGNPVAGATDGDPEVIYLSSIEQSISSVKWLACRNAAINQNKHYINLQIPNTGTAISSLKLDGATVNPANLIVHPQAAGYSYAVLNVSGSNVAPGTPHVLTSDSGFNAIAYGYGNAESYGYNAGTNIKDLYQQIGVHTQYGIELTPSVCTGTPFKFKVSLPYEPDSMHWDFHGAIGMNPNNTNVSLITPPGSYDSTTVVNGKTIYWYSLPTQYNFSNVGTFPVTITTFFIPNAESCGDSQDIDFDLLVYDPPSADFTWITAGCVAEPYQFTETTAQVPKPTYNFNWDFGDPGSGAANISTVRNPTHTFSTPGPHTVTFWDITTTGCISNTVSHIIDVPALPSATISGTTTVCINALFPSVTFTGTDGTAPYTFSYTIDAGSGPGPIQTVNSTGTTATIPVSTFTAGTFIYTLVSVKNVTGTLCTQNIAGQQATITVTPDATITLSSAAGTANQTVCVNNPITNITYAVGASGAGASITAGALPAGVTGSFAGGVFTISGTPTVTGTFNYTVSTSGPCANPSLSGSITVSPDASINLSSAPGTDAQTVCINNPISTLSYLVSGSGTGASITAGALPAGVTGSFVGGVYSITGTPTVSGVFNFTITTAGPCVNNSLSAIITVNDNSTISLTSAPPTTSQTLCINSPITNITYGLGGGATGASITAGSLPAGVTGTFAAGVFTISGTPTVSGVFNYTVSAVGPCNNPSLSGTITVNANASINLISGPGSDAQTVCINSPIAGISYSIGGGGTGASITAGALPAGVTGNYVGGVFTISGTPTVSGVFNYTVTTTSTCINNSLSGTITVNDNSTITLSSAAGTNTQTVCINNAITSITYAVANGGTGASITLGSLPAGVTGSFAAGVFTISGTPTAPGVFNYTVTTTGPCNNPSLSGTITVTDNSILTLTSGAGSANQTACINNPIINITYTITGGGTGASITAGALPAGVTGNYAGGVFTISGSPTVNGVFNYTVGTTGPCINNSLSGTITINGNSTLLLTSAPGTDAQTVCINNAINTISYAAGGGATNVSITAGSLPTGVTGSFAAGVFTISGTPTVSGTYNYTITTTGPCVNQSQSGAITVNDNSTITLTSGPGSNTQTVCINNPIINISYSITAGGTGASITAGALPAGVTGSYVGGVFTITGTPTAAGVFNYTVGTTGPCVNNSLSGTITVNNNSTLTLTSAAGSNTQTVCINNAITNISYAVTAGGTGASITSGSLPAGVTGTFAGGVFTITGTPTAAGVFNYTVTTTGPCVNPSLSGTITVNDNSTITLTSGAGSNTQTVCINNAITNISYSITGGGTGASITAGALPAGVTGTYAGGVFTITGSPTVAGVFNYTVGTTGPCINNVLSGTITVNGNSTMALTSAAGSNNQTLCVNIAITNITYAVSGTGTGASITAGSLPAGVTGTYAGGVFTISGTPTSPGVYNYTVTTTGPCVNPSLSGTITVNDNSTITLTSGVGSNTQTVCINNAITNISYSITGGGTGASITAGALPAGVTGTYAGGVFTITGSPTVAGVFNYTVGTTGPCVNNTLSGTITVNGNSTMALTSAAGSNNQTLCVNIAITNITYAISGTGTGASITAGSLPAGVTGTYAGGVFTISGTPTAPGVFNYTVTTTGPCSNPSLSGTITVNDNSSINLTSAPGSDAQTVCINTAMSNIVYTIAGGGTGASITAGALPAGVTGTYAGGVFTISGTPSVNGVFNYTVTTTGPCINNARSGTITVNANATLNLSSAPGSNNQTVCINNAIGNITYAVGGTGTGASITAGALPTGVTGSFAGGVFTISGTPTVAGVFNYTVSSTGPCGNGTASGTITVNDNSSISLTSAPGTNTQTVCLNIAITDINYTIGGGGTGASITAGSLPAGVTGTYVGGAFTITGTPTASGTFNYTVTTTGPCINNALSGSITVNPIPTALISGNIEVCEGTAPAPDVTFTGAGGTRPYTFTYTIDNGSGPGPALTVTTVGASNSVTVQQPTTVPGTYVYDLVSVSDGTPTACNQSQSGTVTVKVNPLPTATISGTKLVCINSTPPPITFTGAGGTLPYTFTYTVTGVPGNQTISTTGSNSSVTLSAPTTAAGTFTYHLVSVKDGTITACSQAQPADAVIDVSNVIPKPDFSFNNNICLPNALVTFQNLSTIASGPPSSMTYVWNFGDATITSNAFAPTHTYYNPGPFSINLEATSAAGCVHDTTIVLNTIHPQPKADFTTDKPYVCVATPVVFTDITDPTAGATTTARFWELGDGMLENSQSFTYLYSGPDTFYVKLYITNSFGCNSDTVTKPFPVYDYPQVNAGPDDFILEGGTITLNPTVTGQNLQYLWTPNLYLDDNTKANPKVHDPKADITYTLTVTGIGGCPKSDAVFIKLLKFPTIPNTFTPNGDGINDKWIIGYLNTYPDNWVQVFTRSGQMVYESHGYKPGTEWDGTIKGKKLPVDTYYYIIEPGSGRDPIKGYVTIIK